MQSRAIHDLLVGPAKEDGSPRSPQRLSSDFVIIGAGLAGLVAATALADAGRDVVIVEAAETCGGASALSGGLFAFAGTDGQQKAGIDDSADLLRADLSSSADRAGCDVLIDLYVRHQLHAMEWLSRLGIEWELSATAAGSGHSVPRVHRTDPEVLIQTIASRVLASPRVKLATRCRVESVRSCEEGWELETRTAGDDRGSVISCTSLIVCSGGFAANRALLERKNPYLAHTRVVTAPYADGQILTELAREGAGTRDLDVVEATFGTHVSDAAPLYPCLAIYLGAIAVNREGRRFVNESLPYKLVGRACLAQTGGVAVQVMDSSVFEAGVSGIGPFDLENWRANGLFEQADTLRELAELTDIPATTLVEQVARYNFDIQNGFDREYGRCTLPGNRQRLRALETPPFFASRSSAAVYGTYGGLSVDARLAVATVDHGFLHACHAAGECVGGFHGAGYVTGTSLGKALIFGRIAALEAAGCETSVATVWS